MWIEEFRKQGFEIEVICLEKGEFSGSFPVHSLGKEEGVGLFGRMFRFLKLIVTLKYDRVFIHMNPEYFTIGGWWWALRGVPSYLWYTHYTMTIHLWFAGIFAKYLFAATPQSLPQYEGNPKKVILGHGIDVKFWEVPSTKEKINSYEMISVHRLSRSKRLEIALKTLVLLPKEYTLVVYGRAVDPQYFKELENLIEVLKISSRVQFKGSVPMPELRQVYPHHRLMINMASETIDKTMLEGMLFGLYPITTPNNSQAIGLPVWPGNDTPEKVAEFILSQKWETYDKEILDSIVHEKHSLTKLVQSLSKYIKKEK